MKPHLLTTLAMCAVFACGLSSCKKSSNLPAAAAAGDLEAVKSMLEKKADVNAKEDKLGSTALVEAATNGHTEVVTTLIIAGADLNIKDKREETALIRAARNGHTETVAAILSFRDANGNPLTDVNNTSKSGTTALHAAAWAGHPATILVLLNNGANPNQADVNEGTPLTLAAHKKTDTPEAAAKQTEVIKTLLDKGANVNALDVLGRSALMYAAENNNATNVALLLEKQADPNLHDRTGRTALLIATEAGHADIAKTLVAAGATMSPKDLESYINRTIHTIPNIVELLKNTGLNLAAKGEDGKSALTIATEKRHQKTVEALQAAGITE